MRGSGLSSGEGGEPRSGIDAGSSLYRLPRTKRITESGEIDALFREGAKQVGRLMVLWAMNVDHRTVRVAVIAGKKSFPDSVDRSRVKRLLRESFRLEQGRFARGVDILMVGRKPILKVKCSAVREELVSLAEKTGILRVS